MIEIHSFTNANKLYQTKQIPSRILQDQAAVLLNYCAMPCPSVSNATEITADNIGWLLQQPEATDDYSIFLGGNVFVCETESDLQQIKGCDFAWAETHGDWPNVTDIAMFWDGCEYVNELNGDPQWVTFYLCWNNAGGPIYYVPKKLWGLARVEEHIKLTEQLWK